MRGQTGMRTGVLALFAVTSIFFVSSCSDKIKPGEVDVERHKGGPVKVAALALVPKGRFHTAVGTVRPKKSATLSPQVMGMITGVYAREGNRVKEGALLLTIDDSGMRANVQAAEGMLEEAQRAREEVEAAIGQAESGAELAGKTYNRFKALYEQKIVSQQEFDEVVSKYEVAKRQHDIALSRRNQAGARVAQAQARLQNARIMLGYTRVSAPFDGVVARKYADPGSMASPGMPLFLIEEAGNFRLEVSIPEGFAWIIREGVACGITIDAAAMKEEGLKVSEVVPELDPATRSFIVKVDLPRIEGIRSGMFGRATFRVGEESVLAVPEGAIIRVGGYQGVYVVGEGNVSRFHMVKTGESFGGMVEILSGLHEGQEVVVSGGENVRDGDVVEVAR